MGNFEKSLNMDESDLKKNCRDLSFLNDLQDPKASISELDILRRAYELVLENSDLFFRELRNSFSIERDKGEFNPLI
jgi:hypothetical protein